MLFLAVWLKETRHLTYHGRRMDKDLTSQQIHDWLRLARTIIIIWQLQMFDVQTQENTDVWLTTVSTLPLHLPPNWKYIVSIGIWKSFKAPVTSKTAPASLVVWNNIFCFDFWHNIHTHNCCYFWRHVWSRTLFVCRYLLLLPWQ